MATSFRELRRRFGPVQFLLSWLGTRRWRHLLGGVPAILMIVVGLFLYAEVRRESGAELLNHYVAGGRKALADDNMEGAELRFRRAILLSPQHSEARLGTAEAAEKSGDVARAFQLMASIAEGKDEAATRANFWIVQKTLANPESTPEQRRALLKRLERIVEQNPRHAEAQLLLARFYIAAGLQEQGTERLRIAADLDEESQLLLAMRYSALQQAQLASVAAKRAERVFEDKLRKTPNDVQVRLQYVATLVLQERFPDAVASLQQGLKLQQDEKLQKQLAMTYAAWADFTRRSNKDDSRMLDLLSSALRLDPQNAPALIMLIQLSQNASEHGEDAKKVLEERLASGQAPWVIHLILGTSAIGEAEADSAKTHLEQALAQNPKVPATLNNLAWILSRQKEPDLDRAFGLADQAVKLAPSSPELRETRGQILAKQGKWQEALTDLESVLPYYTNSPRLEAELPQLHVAIATSYENLGNAEMAKLHRDKAGDAGKNVKAPDTATETPAVPPTDAAAQPDEPPTGDSPKTDSEPAAVEASPAPETTTPAAMDEGKPEESPTSAQ
jgi:Tfp pilus assembly protein PilF